MHQLSVGKLWEHGLIKEKYNVSNLFEYQEFGNLLMKNQNRKIMENPCALISYVCFYDSKKIKIKIKIKISINK